jgi:seryl-tRNA synthetase
MLDLALVRAEPARVKAALARRGVPADAVDAVLAIDVQWADRHEVREALRFRRRRAASRPSRSNPARPPT